MISVLTQLFVEMIMTDRDLLATRLDQLVAILSRMAPPVPQSPLRRKS